LKIRRLHSGIRYLASQVYGSSPLCEGVAGEPLGIKETSGLVSSAAVSHVASFGVRRATVNDAATCLKLLFSVRLGLADEVHRPLFCDAVASELKSAAVDAISFIAGHGDNHASAPEVSVELPDDVAPEAIV
jgi:hypothetical protein